MPNGCWMPCRTLVWARRETMNYQGQSLHVLSKADVIATKLAAGRDVDLQDVRLLRASDDEEPPQ